LVCKEINSDDLISLERVLKLNLSLQFG